MGEDGYCRGVWLSGLLTGDVPGRAEEQKGEVAGYGGTDCRCEIQGRV